MANPEHIEKMNYGSEEWNIWRSKQKEKFKPDLSHAVLQDTDFEGFNLSRVNFRGSDISGSNLMGVDLSGADLSKANLDGVVLRNANLHKANLKKARINKVGLVGIVKKGGKNVMDVYYKSPDLSGADLSGAKLTEAKLYDANLSNANLSGANLDIASLRFVNLEGAILKKASLISTTIFGSSLIQADLTGMEVGHTIMGMSDIGNCIGFETVEVSGHCTIDFHTLSTSNSLPNSFLLKIGLPEHIIINLPDLSQERNKRFYPVFLSHSWANKPFARKLYEALIAKGVNVFFDEKKFKPGDNLYESVSKGIENYDKMILVCSKDSLTESWWVDREIDRVLAKEKDLFNEIGESVHLLIPITIDDYVFQWKGAKKEDIKRYMIGNFKNWEDDIAFEKALNDLIHALNPDRSDIKPVSYLPRKPKP